MNDFLAKCINCLDSDQQSILVASCARLLIILIIHFDWLIVNPLRDQIIHWCFLPLRCHVPNTSNCSEVKVALVLLDESLNLATVNPSDPRLHYVPVKLLNPSNRSKSRHSAVRVSGEEQHLNVRLVLHHAVDPKWSLILQLPIFVHIVVAINPCTGVVVVEWVINMQKVLNFLVVEIVGDQVCPEIVILKCFSVFRFIMLQPSANVIWIWVTSLIIDLSSIFQSALSVIWVL